MRIPKLGRAKFYCSRMTAPFQARVAILLYHRIFEAQSDYWDICVSPKHFREHLEYLSENFNVISLFELMRCLKGRRLPKRAVVLTFDDGYADNLLEAKPLLERYDTPATVFVSTGHLGENREFWWDELEKLVLLAETFPRRLELSVGGKTHHWEMNISNSSSISTNGTFPQNGKSTTEERMFRHEVFNILHQLLRPIAHEERNMALDQLWSQMERRRSPRPSYRALTMEEVRRLADERLVEIGAHTVTHPVLPSQEPGDQQWEMKESKRKLEEIVGRPVQSFAYPYGKMDQTSTQIAQDLGFQSAYSTMNKTVTHGANYFTLPRFFVGNWGGDEFARRLQTFFWK